MNKVILMGRFTKDPEVRYSQAAEPVAVVRFSIAVNRRFKRPNEPDADFFDCVSFGKNAEFIEKYFRKGMLASIVGSLRNDSWEDKATGQKRTRTEVVVEETYFAESKSSFESRNESRANTGASAPQGAYAPISKPQSSGYQGIEESLDDEDLPF